jgi:mannose-1-phosphate guanylyltransferase/mannose-6-phosphate isomerase
LSRKSYPKQFVPLVGENTLFQQAALRGDQLGLDKPMVVTNSDFRFIVTEQLTEAGVDPAAVLIEPAARNTAPAVLAATLHAAKSNPEGLILVFPSDHLIRDVAKFGEALQNGVVRAEAGDIVTFGIAPDRPETGYGYLELGSEPEGGVAPLTRFVEKPDLARAEEMCAAGTYMWNAGLFLFRADTLLKAYEEHQPEMLRLVTEADETAEADLGFLRLAPGPFEACEDISIDFAIMEKIPNLSVAVHSGDWNDLGGWEAVLRETDQDDRGLGVNGSVTSYDCKDSLLRSEVEDVHLVGLGLENIIAVAMPDAVLVADRSRSADVGKVVKEMRAKAVKQANQFPRDHRPWGFFETLTLSDRFQVKRIVVHPGAALSLQSHFHRSEHWIVVSGTAKVTVDDDVRLVTENQSVYIPLGAIHRMENPGKVAMELIEVQTGAYLGEDDIVRYEDVYSRS